MTSNRLVVIVTNLKPLRDQSGSGGLDIKVFEQVPTTKVYHFFDLLAKSVRKETKSKLYFENFCVHFQNGVCLLSALVSIFVGNSEFLRMSDFKSLLPS